MNFTNDFIVGSINDYTLTDPDDKGGVGGMDPLSSQTAWLYTQFYNGTLANYVYGFDGNAVFTNREASANALQHAFWGFENEETLDTNNFYVQLALNNTPADFEIGRVGVLNLYLYDKTKPGGLGAEAQDQLTMRVPEPATLALMGVGMLGMTVVRRRMKK
jgi:PEP-CTERM putative exosortase interaction domain